MAKKKQERIIVDNFLFAFLRTEMANRRTLLAYFKLGIGILISGFGLIKFGGAGSKLEMAGFVFMPLSALVFGAGIFDYIQTNKKIKEEKDDAGV